MPRSQGESAHETYDDEIQHRGSEGQGNLTGFGLDQVMSASRLKLVLQRMLRLKRLQSQATSAQIKLEQKSTEVENARREVSTSDANFMRTLQELIALGKPEGFDELPSLFNECQKARDQLGPLEAEEFEEKSKWLGKMWKLKAAEELFLEDFSSEFDAAEDYSTGPPSVDSRYYESHSERETQTLHQQFNESPGSLPSRPNSLQISSTDSLPSITQEEVLDIATTAQEASDVEGSLSQEDGSREYLPKYSTEGTDSESYLSDSQRSADLDQILDNILPTSLSYGPMSPSTQDSPQVGIYSDLLKDFTTKRDRVTKWLLQKVLLSPMDADLLKVRLDSENSNLPSNWAQLVIAWWEYDMTATANTEKASDSLRTEPVLEDADHLEETKLFDEPAPSPSQFNQVRDAGTDVESEYPAETASVALFSSPPSISSHSSITDPLGAVSESITLIVDHDDLKPLFDKSRQFLDVTVFYQQIIPLLAQFAHDLVKEAKLPNEELVARFFHDSRKEIARQMRQRIYGSQSIAAAMDQQGPNKRENIERYLKGLRPGRPENTDQAQCRDDESSEDEEIEATTIPAFENIKRFILESGAFSKFQFALKMMLEPTEQRTEPGFLNIKTDSGENSVSSTVVDFGKPLPIVMAGGNSDTLAASLNPGPENFYRNPQAASIAATNKSVATQQLVNYSTEQEERVFEEAANQSANVPSRELANPNTTLPTFNLGLSTPPQDTQNRSPVSLKREAVEEAGRERPWERVNRPLQTAPMHHVPSPSKMKEIITGKGSTNSDDIKLTHNRERPPSAWSEWEWNNAYACESRYRITANTGIFSKDYEFQYRETQERTSTRQSSRRENESASTLTSINESRLDPSTSRTFDNDGSASKAPKTWPLRKDIPYKNIRTRDPQKEAEDLDPNYRVHASREFTFGRVFKVLWTEPKGSEGTEISNTAVRRSKYGEESYTSIRRFMIVRSFEGHSLCLPILTYGGQATLKKGVKSRDHCIVHTTKIPVMKQKENIFKRPIRIIPDSPRDKLDSASRMNYAKSYTVEHNCKVCFIGRISPKYQQAVVDDYNLAHQVIPDSAAYTETTEDTYSYAQGGDNTYASQTYSISRNLPSQNPSMASYAASPTLYTNASSGYTTQISPAAAYMQQKHPQTSYSSPSTQQDTYQTSINQQQPSSEPTYMTPIYGQPNTLQLNQSPHVYDSTLYDDG